MTGQFKEVIGILFLTILIMAGAAGILLAGPCIAEATAGEVTPEVTIERALLWVVRDAPRHPVRVDAEYRRTLSRAFDAAALETDLDAALLIAVAYHESSLRVDARGRIGEIGLMQTHGRAVGNNDMTTPQGQIMAGSRWLRRAIDICRSIPGGLAMYATGRTCSPRSSRLRYLVARRIELWRAIDRLAYPD